MDNDSYNAYDNYDYTRAFERRLDAQRENIEATQDFLNSELEKLYDALDDLRSSIKAQSLSNGFVQERVIAEELRTIEDRFQLMSSEMKMLENKVDVQSGSVVKFPGIVTYPVMFILLALVLFTSSLRIIYLIDNDDITAEDTSVTQEEATRVLHRAEDAVASVELVLGFLEGASVLVAVALGAAAVYGVRQTNQLRLELRSDLESTVNELRRARLDDRKVLDNARATLEELRRYQPRLEELNEIEHNLLQKTREVGDEVRHKALSTVGRLLQADQEFRLRNYKLSYTFISDVLEEERREARAKAFAAGDPDAATLENFEPTNTLALYLAGWMEIQHIDNRHEEGLRHLQRLVELEPRWPSALAAYGVALRRQAMREADADGNPNRELMNMAQGMLYQALGRDDDLVDFNKESYWGPLGGLLRDIGDIDQAIGAYANARRVTPGSSYPAGNMASLLLRKTQDDPSQEKRAMEAFAETVKLANSELAHMPNDYFLLMDLAMARTVLSYRDAPLLEEARRNLQQALHMRPSKEHLGVSVRGWQNLIKFSPNHLNWRATKSAMQEMLAEVEAARARAD